MGMKHSRVVTGLRVQGMHIDVEDQKMYITAMLV